MEKVLIEIKGGNVQFIASSPDVKIVIVDHDNYNAGDPPVSCPEPDYILKESIDETFADVFIPDNEDKFLTEVHDELKRLHV